MSSGPRTFWALRGQHFGARWHLFTSLNELENKKAKFQEYRAKDIEQIQLIEMSAYDALAKERDALRNTLAAIAAMPGTNPPQTIDEARIMARKALAGYSEGA